MRAPEKVVDSPKAVHPYHHVQRCLGRVQGRLDRGLKKFKCSSRQDRVSASLS
jgi:hypothetical protein